MKKLFRRLSFALLLALMLACLALPAFAATYETTRSCTVYSATELVSNPDGLDTTPEPTYIFQAIGSLPAGVTVTPIKSYGGKRQVHCSSMGYVWIDGDAIGRVDDSAEVDDHGPTIRPGNTGGTGGTGASREPAKPKSSGIWKNFKLTLLQSDGTEIPVTLETLGSARCVVFDGQEMLTVNTTDLIWESDAPEEKRIAYIYAPRTGKCSLRSKASDNYRTLRYCEAGRLVIVLRVGQVYTRILYEGTEGFVLTGALQFLPIAQPDDFTVTTLMYEGRTDSAATISMYHTASADRKLKQFRVGKEAELLGEQDTWAEIELEGMHGFVKPAYLESAE